MQLQPVGPAGLDTVWPVVVPWLARACARPGCDLAPEALHEMLAAQQGQLILILDDGHLVAAGVTQVRQYESGRLSCWVLVMGGRGVWAWRETLRQIEAGAARVGCAAVEFVGRAGWGRVLPDYAASPCETGIHFSKQIGA